MSNRVSFELSASNQFLSDLFESMLDEAVSSEPLEVNSVEIILKRIGEAELRPEGKSINIYLPLHIQLKRPAGLFTVEGSGSINLHLTVDFDIDSAMMLSAKSSLVSHEWLEKPVLEIGALNIPIETLVNLVLNHHESIITAKIDASLKEYSNLNHLLQIGLNKAKESIKEQDLRGNEIELNLQSVSLIEPSIENKKVFVKGFITPTIGINTNAQIEQQKIGFNWIEPEILSEESSVQIDIESPYDMLKDEIKESLHGFEVGGKHFDVRSIDISGGEELNIQLEIEDPIKAQVYIHGIPIYNELEGLLRIEDIDVKVNPANFIYKLTAPLVNKFIESKMSDFFPLQVNEKLTEAARSNIPSEIHIPNGKINVTHKELKIDSLEFIKDRIKAKTSISDLYINITHQ